MTNHWSGVATLGILALASPCLVGVAYGDDPVGLGFWTKGRSGKGDGNTRQGSKGDALAGDKQRRTDKARGAQEDYWDTHDADGSLLDEATISYARETNQKLREMGRHNCAEAAIKGEVIRRIDGHTYEVETEGRWGVGMGEVSERAILKTSKTRFNNSGKFRICVRRHRGKQKVTLKSDFTALLIVYTEGEGSSEL